jgi:hypothetical protein
MANEFYPSPAQYIACGSIGVVLFFILMISAVYLLLYKTPPKNKDSFYFYICITIMSICELPRYFDMIADGSYNCKVCYSFHIIADLLYFVCLAIVILKFVHILELGPLTSVFYTRRGMIIAVVIQAIINFCAYVYCLNSSSLDAFFNSTMFAVFTVFDIVQNFLYTAVLSMHGVRLVLRYTT